MKRQVIQFGVIACVLVVCIIGYFALSDYFTKAEKNEEEDNRIVAFTLEDYKEVKRISYICDNETLKLEKENGKWSVTDDADIKVDNSVIESEMLSKLVEVIAQEEIENVKSEEDYGFIKSDDEMAAATNTIRITDKNDEEHVIYIGNANPYDASLYYMMVKGDDKVYVISSDVVDAFSKTVEDIEEETTTEEITTVEETTNVQNENVETTEEK